MYPTVEENALEFRCHQWADWPTLQGHWVKLYNTVGSSTIFVSPEWVTTWGDHFSSDVSITIVTASHENDVIGSCLLSGVTRKNGPFNIHYLYLNTAGEPLEHSVWLEFNSILCEEGYEEKFAYGLARELRRIQWDVFQIQNCLDSMTLRHLSDALSPFHDTTSESPSRHILLDDLRNPQRSLHEMFPSKLRQQMNQTVRLYSAIGEIALHAASSVAEAHQYLDELAVLHEQTWLRRGLAQGAFGSPRFVSFHKELIATIFADGRVHLLKITAGKTTVGVLYVLSDDVSAYSYQSGLSPASSNRMKPGFLCRVLAANYFRDGKLKRYEFMGSQDYQMQLGNCQTEQHSHTFMQKNVTMISFGMLRTAVRVFRRAGRTLCL